MLQVLHVAPNAAIHCAPITQPTATPHVRIAAGRYFLVVETRAGTARGTMQLMPRSGGDTVHSPLVGTANVNFRSARIDIDSTIADVRVIELEGPVPTIIQIDGDKDFKRGLALDVSRLTAGGFDGSWSFEAVDGHHVGDFCAFRALNRSP